MAQGDLSPTRCVCLYLCVGRIYQSSTCTVNNQADDAHNGDNAREINLPCPVELNSWLSTSCIIPSTLAPGKGGDVLPSPIGTNSQQLEIGGPAIGDGLSRFLIYHSADTKSASQFRDNSDSVSVHNLLCLGDADSPTYWFLTSAEDSGKVWAYLRARDGSNTVQNRALDPKELADAPFTVYFHKQRAGDLLVVPPRW